MKYDLVKPNDPALRTSCEPFDFATGNAQELAEDLITTMEHYNGLGLAANQVGIGLRVFVLRGDPYAVFNPKIVDTSSQEVMLDEGCLTYPGLYVKVKRPSMIRVRFTDINGQTKTEKYTGMTARIFQHEIEHLDGGLFYNNASLYHRERGFNTQKKYLRHPERYTVKQP
jgi:peptide deformylase